MYLVQTPTVRKKRPRSISLLRRPWGALRHWNRLLEAELIDGRKGGHDTQERRGTTLTRRIILSQFVTMMTARRKSEGRGQEEEWRKKMPLTWQQISYSCFLDH
jgi:molybdenum-dependent DNA-binding transcriptional regulator ModE